MGYLKQMFPSKGEPEISKALMDVKGDQETAFDILMGAGMDKMGSSVFFFKQITLYAFKNISKFSVVSLIFLIKDKYMSSCLFYL